ncbi:hypothetical protein ACIQVK_41410 [Streptomyces sp. NPDC090493]|uniref:hypothetical protein n=1 Tax=Streptomyces sp. NPDC090493 TaxID=3365964 RepID=UPI0037F4A19C
MGELVLGRTPAEGEEADRLIRLLVDVPAASRDLVRLLPEAGACCPVAVLVQQIPRGGTRLIYDSVASAISVYLEEQALEVARGIDADILALLRRAATREGLYGD